MPKLTILNQQYPPEVAATGQIFQAIAEHFAACGWEVTVVTGTPYYPGLTEKCPRRERVGGVDVRRLWNTTFPKRSFLGKLANLLTFEASLFVYCLFSIGREERVLVGTAPPLAVVCAAVGRRFRRFKAVLTVQDLYPDVLAASGDARPASLTYRLLRFCMRRSMAACDRVVTISADMRRHLLEAYGLKRVDLIPNLFPERIAPVPPAEAKAIRGWEGRLVVQYSGNFGVAHEPDTLLGAVRLLKDDPRILFQVAGAGRNYDRLLAAKEEEGLHNLVLEGYAPLDQLERHLGTGDIAVVVFSAAFRDVLLPSKYYGILASGRGVLLISGCDSDIRRDIQSQGIGLVFDHGQSRDLAKALLSLLDAPERLAQMGARSRALYEAKYERQAILEAYRHLLEEVQ